MHWEEVDRFARAALADSKRLGPRVELSALDLLAMFAEAQGRFDEAREYFHRLDERYAELGLEIIRLSESMDVGHLELLAGEPEAAEQALREGWVGLGELGERGFRSTIGAVLGWALVEQDRLDEAEQIVAEAEELASSDDFATAMYVLTTRARIALGLVLIRAGRPDEARTSLADALERAERKGALVLAEWARDLLAKTD